MAKHPSFSSLINLQSKSINFKFGHFWAKYQGYSLTFWPSIAHFHHVSFCNQTQSISNLVIFEQNTKAIALLFGQTICNQNQSISNLVIFEQNTKAIALLYGQTSLIFVTYQSAIKINQLQIWSFFQQNTKAIALLFGQASLIFITFHSAKNSINFKFGHFWAKYQGYSLTFWPNIAHFHHFSIGNQNQSISNLVIFEQNTKAIALLYGQISLIFITYQSAIKINQFQIWSFLSKIPRL